MCASRRSSAFHLHARGEVAEAPTAAYDRIAALLGAAGWKAKVERRAAAAGSGTSASRGTMIAARRGAANKIGYLAAHSAIVLICIGGLFDGDLIVRALAAVQGKSSYGGGGLIRDVAPEHRLGPGTPTFRANLLVPEGGRAGVAIINQADGVVLQELPFDIELKKFIVEYYETGMPKLFASEVVIHDRDTGEALPATIKVNQPAFHRGVAIYQSSFDDGGSRLKLRALPMTAGAAPFELQGTVGESGPLALQRPAAEPRRRRRPADARARPACASSTSRTSPPAPRRPARPTSRRSAWPRPSSGSSAPAPANAAPTARPPRRCATSARRSATSCATPAARRANTTTTCCRSTSTASASSSPACATRRPTPSATCASRPTTTASIDGWLRLRAALLDPARRAAGGGALRRSWRRPPTSPAMAPQLEATALRVLALFAGAEPAPGRAPAGRRRRTAGAVRLHREHRAAGRARAHLRACCCASSTAACSSCST